MGSNESIIASNHHITKRNTGKERWVGHASTCFPFCQLTVFQIITCFSEFNWSPPPPHTHSNTHLPFMCESMQEIDCDGPHFLLFFRLTAS